jgi:hypothetical protein
MLRYTHISCLVLPTALCVCVAELETQRASGREVSSRDTLHLAKPHTVWQTEWVDALS